MFTSFELNVVFFAEHRSCDQLLASFELWVTFAWVLPWGDDTNFDAPVLNQRQCVIRRHSTNYDHMQSQLNHHTLHIVFSISQREVLITNILAILWHSDQLPTMIQRVPRDPIPAVSQMVYHAWSQAIWYHGTARKQLAKRSRDRSISCCVMVVRYMHVEDYVNV